MEQQSSQASFGKKHQIESPPFRRSVIICTKVLQCINRLLSPLQDGVFCCCALPTEAGRVREIKKKNAKGQRESTKKTKTPWNIKSGCSWKNGQWAETLGAHSVFLITPLQPIVFFSPLPNASLKHKAAAKCQCRNFPSLYAALACNCDFLP